MNTIVTSKEAILSESKKIVMNQGVSAVNMRNVANACGVAVGSIYNYFPSKAELIGATVDVVWQDIFPMTNDFFTDITFIECLTWLFDCIKDGRRRYPGFFTLHSLSFAADNKAKGRELMEQRFGHMRKGLLKVLKQDSKKRPDAFSETFTPEQLASFIFTVFLSMLLSEDEECDTLLEMVRRSIY